jgi:hypothetical protein
MFKYILNKLPKKDIYREDGSLYLTRYYIYRKKYLWLPSLYIHCFHSSDYDMELHNHGWEYSCSLILKGKYKEEYRTKDMKVKERILGPGRFNLIKSSKFHRIDLVTPKVWTLFFSGWKKEGWSWGFWNRDSGLFMNHEDFFKVKNNI